MGKGPETEKKNERLLVAGKTKKTLYSENRIRRGGAPQATTARLNILESLEDPMREVS